MVAAENDALIRGKVGGLADVVRDLPRALIDLGLSVDVITPAYGFLQNENPSELHATVDFPFKGKRQSAAVFRVKTKTPHERVSCFVVEHPDLRGNPIYYNDPPATPFLRDAEKYALFSSAVGKILGWQEETYALHLHDWHSGFLFLLQRRHPEFAHLQKIRTLYTIHNIGVQGTRPFEGNTSTVTSWFPELFASKDWIEEWQDPQWDVPCFNPMLAGIRHADALNTVSPGYAEEILHPSDHANGFFGGEGLERELTERKKEGALSGILNGCEYPPAPGYLRMSCDELLGFLQQEIRRSSGVLKGASAVHLEALRQFKPEFILTGVTRIVEQKVQLFLEHGSDGRSAIERLVDLLAEQNGACVLLGSGIPEYEEKFIALTEKNRRFVFIRGYSEKISEALYANGTLFLMPSSFEPCGISQMIAMREGQPCVVHAVGGLRDTVTDGLNGFTFDGKNPRQQVDAFVGAVTRAVRWYLEDKARWEAVRNAALRARFTWESSARRYLELLG